MRPYPIHLSALCLQLGLSKTALKKIAAEKIAPADRDPSNPGLILESGAQKIRAALGLPEPPAPLGSSADTHTARAEKNAATGRVALTVRRLPKAPGRILFCFPIPDHPGVPGPHGHELRLQVKSTENFRPGMICRTCTPHHSIPAFFNFEGRLPRWKGRF